AFRAGWPEHEVLGVLLHVLGACEEVVDSAELEARLGEVAWLEVLRPLVLIGAENEGGVELRTRSEGVRVQDRHGGATQRIVRIRGVGAVDICPGSGKAPAR